MRGLRKLKQQKKEEAPGGGGGQAGGKVIASRRKGKRKTKAYLLRLTKDWNEYDTGVGKANEAVTFPQGFKGTGLAHFEVQIVPAEGPYKNARFDFVIDVPEQYPIEAPIVKCKTTPIYHPNINFKGDVCLSVLREGWKPIYTVTVVVIGLHHLFLHPNPKDPLPNGYDQVPDGWEAADVMRKDEAKFAALVRRTLNGGAISELNNKTFPKVYGLKPATTNGVEQVKANITEEEKKAAEAAEKELEKESGISQAEIAVAKKFLSNSKDSVLRSMNKE